MTESEPALKSWGHIWVLTQRGSRPYGPKESRRTRYFFLYAHALDDTKSIMTYIDLVDVEFVLKKPLGGHIPPEQWGWDCKSCHECERLFMANIFTS